MCNIQISTVASLWCCTSLAGCICSYVFLGSLGVVCMILSWPLIAINWYTAWVQASSPCAGWPLVSVTLNFRPVAYYRISKLVRIGLPSANHIHFTAQPTGPAQPPRLHRLWPDHYLSVFLRMHNAVWTRAAVLWHCRSKLLWNIQIFLPSHISKYALHFPKETMENR